MEYSSRISQGKIYFGKRKREFFSSKKLIKTILYTLAISLLLVLVMGNALFINRGVSWARFFILSCICIFYGIFNSIKTVCSEREIIKHEHRSGMYISSYILGNAAFDFFICLIQAAVTWIVFMVRYIPVIIEENHGLAFLHVPGYLITMVIITFAADALGLCVSSLVKNTDTAMKAMPFVMILQVAFAGVILPLPGILRLISHLTLSRWGTYAMYDVAFDLHTRTWYQVLTLQASEAEQGTPGFFSCWLVLIGMTILFLGLSILFLHSVDKDQR